jgi:hypothetical protein
VGRLIGGVRAAKTAAHLDLADRHRDVDLLDDEIGDGLSANLCEALIKLAGEKDAPREPARGSRSMGSDPAHGRASNRR